MFKHNVSILVVVGLILVASNLGASGIKLRTPEDLTKREIDQLLAQIGESFDKINEHLEAKVESDDAAQNIAEAEKLLGDTKLGEELRKALNLFVSLKGVEADCSMEGYNIIARNWVAISYHLQDIVSSRVQVVLDHYRTKHAEKCRPGYFKAFDEKFKSVSPDDMTKITESLDYLDGTDFRCPGIYFRRDNELEMDTPNFLSKCSPLRTLIYNIARQVEKTDQWEQLKSKSRKDILPKEYPIVPREVFDEYLFKPCENFREHLADILTPARLDAAIADDHQRDYVYGNEKFFRAMINNRYCGSLLEQREQLYSVLIETWDTVMSWSDY